MVAPQWLGFTMVFDLILSNIQDTSFTSTALSFTHLIPKYDDFVKFGSLLLNSYLLLKNSTVTSNIFKEIHNARGLKLLKLMRVLDPYKTLVASLDGIYLRKKEPRVREFTSLLLKMLGMLVKKLAFT